MIKRLLESPLEKDLLTGDKVIIVYGPRQVGKTTLVKSLLKRHERALVINADLMVYNEVFSSRDLHKMRELIGSHEILFIDEAQNIPDIGINLKILHDEMPELRIIVTGSSSFDLANIVREPLTGRTKTHYLYPISIQELVADRSAFTVKNELESLLLYGSYPEILNVQGLDEKQERLSELAAAYLYKDVLQLSGIRHSDKIHKLLQMLALQVGSTVSFNELGTALGMSQETVASYIDLLEKGFVLFRLPAFSNNPRKEISKMGKIFFMDLGIRNTLIRNFSPLSTRKDKGALWENFLILERMKKLRYARKQVNAYFWRTYTGVELDYVEDAQGVLHGYEMKWSKSKKAPVSWTENYPNALYSDIHSGNFLDFVG